MPILSLTEKQTQKIGQNLADKLKGGDILCLYGELGAGKTALVKGLAKGLGVKKDVTSPTFTLMNVYEVKSQKLAPSGVEGSKVKGLIHIDTYRLKNARELIEIGVEDYLGSPNTICVVEWPEKISELLKTHKCKKIYLKHGLRSNGRIIKY